MIPKIAGDIERLWFSPRYRKRSVMPRMLNTVLSAYHAVVRGFADGPYAWQGVRRAYGVRVTQCPAWKVNASSACACVFEVPWIGMTTAWRLKIISPATHATCPRERVFIQRHPKAVIDGSRLSPR